MPTDPSAKAKSTPPKRQKTRHVVCRASELPQGERLIVDAGGRSIGVFNIQGRFHAIANICPHERAPLCKGTLAPTAYADKADTWDWDESSCVIRCPWHGWEFDIATGRSIFNPHRMGVMRYDVTVEADGSPMPAGQSRSIDCDEPDPELEKFDVAVEDHYVVLYV